MKKNLRTIIVVVICAAMCIGYFYYLSNRDSGKEKNLTEVEQVITKDLDKSYPKTAREVVKFYNRILQCYYNEEHTDDQLAQLTEQARVLMDKELQEKNPEKDYLAAVKLDIETYKEKEKKITSITMDSTNEVEYKTVNGEECAYVDVSYFIMEKDGSSRAEQTYILRKDEDGRWKMLGFYQ